MILTFFSFGGEQHSFKDPTKYITLLSGEMLDIFSFEAPNEQKQTSTSERKIRFERKEKKKWEAQIHP